MKKVNKKKGFTLAELLVVIAVLAILIAIAVPVFSGALGTARDAVEAANLRAAKSAAMVDYVSRGLSGQVGYSYVVDKDSHEITVTQDGTITTDSATDEYSGGVIINGG